MPNVTVVGCGFVGSVFMTEFTKRAFAGKLPGNFRLIDFDQVEARNCANQNFMLSDCGKPKASVLAQMAHANDFPAEIRTSRLTPDNQDVMLEGSDLIIDGVDNLATRQLLWGYGLRTSTPVLHLGIAEQGTGKVEWTYPAHETFSLSPSQLRGKEVLDPASGVTPPCELARMRGVGLAAGFAAATAAAMFFGFDPEAHLEGQESAGWMTEWNATPTGFYPVRETWALRV